MKIPYVFYRPQNEVWDFKTGQDTSANSRRGTILKLPTCNAGDENAVTDGQNTSVTFWSWRFLTLSILYGFSHLLHVSYSTRAVYYTSQHKWMCTFASTMSFWVYRTCRSTRDGNYPKMSLHVLASFYRVWKGWSCSHPLFVIPPAWSLNVSWQLGTMLFQLIAVNCHNTEQVALHLPLATGNINAYFQDTGLSGRSAC